ncbi:MAG: sodium-dependent dicarboxylate transporter 2/3/5 [Verrucomicrobiales bacterium]|jgi:sodium-dependent dicarboxylate transporter 2/3/5
MDAPQQSLRAERGTARRIGLPLGIVLFVAVLIFGDFKPGDPTVTRMAAVAILMATWWITEALPLAATALLPLVLYPLLGILSTKDTAPIYVNHVIFLFVGGFLIALAMERWNLHKRIALLIIRAVGGGPSRLVLSFMLASAFLSMWISNTATAIMMLAIGLAIIKQEEAAFGKERTKNLSVALLLGIAYGASVGGIATLVGTPPNLSLTRIYAIIFPQAPPITFGQWFIMGLPLTVTMLGIVWFMLTRVFYRSPDDLRLSKDVIESEYRSLGRIRFEEIMVAIVFGLTALLWVFRADLQVGSLSIPGWSRLLPNTTGMIDDGTVAIAMALLLFVIPASNRAPNGDQPRALLDLGVFQQLPWHIVLLFGGGFALATGFHESGLSKFIGGGFSNLEGTPPVVMIPIISVSLTFLTELTSNTATTEMVLPILGSMATSMDTHPLLLMIPAALAASCAFMMPVATPPNAIVFGSGRIQIWQMVKIGIVLNLIGVIVITVIFLTLGLAVFDIDPETAPKWLETPE